MKDFLNEFGYQFNSQDSHFCSWYLNVEYKGDLTIHLALMEILANGAERLFETEAPSLIHSIPFGNGPWRCRNKYCQSNKYDVASIRKIKRKYCYEHKNYEGLFVCPECEFSFTRAENSDEIKILYYGKEWKEHYLKDVNQNQSIGKVRYYRRTSEKKGANMSKKVIWDIAWFEDLIRTYRETQSYNKTSNIMNTTAPFVKKLVTLFETYKSLDIFFSLRCCTGFKDFRANQVKVMIQDILTQGNISRNEIKDKIGQHNMDILIAQDPKWVEENLPTK